MTSTFVSNALLRRRHHAFGNWKGITTSLYGPARSTTGQYRSFHGSRCLRSKTLPQEVQPFEITNKKALLPSALGVPALEKGFSMRKFTEPAVVLLEKAENQSKRWHTKSEGVETAVDPLANTKWARPASWSNEKKFDRVPSDQIQGERSWKKGKSNRHTSQLSQNTRIQGNMDTTTLHPDKYAREPTHIQQQHSEKLTNNTRRSNAGPSWSDGFRDRPSGRDWSHNDHGSRKIVEDPAPVVAPTPIKKPPPPVKIQREVFIPEVISVANLARILGIRLENLVRKMMRLDMKNTAHDYLLNADEASLIALEFDMNPIVDSEAALDLYPRQLPADLSIFPLRPPVVTIMGHVDHGKTTLLDTLRKTSVAAGEAGGITQHIGAFLVNLPSGKRITFLDTPGHAAFSAMRSRGAHVTDIVILVVAADDGVMPQTIEAIKHAQAANVAIVVAINKCDKYGADPRKTKEDLLRYGLHLEDLGGDVPAVEVSGMTGLGLPELEETVVTLAEVLELRADQEGAAEGVVIESQVEKGKGTVATVLVRQGTLTVGSCIVAGTTWCKVRSMTDDKGQPVQMAPPGTPVKVIGWKEMPNAGDEMLQAKNEVLARKVVQNRIIKHQRENQLKDLEVINEKRRRDREALEADRVAEKTQRQGLSMQRNVVEEAVEKTSEVEMKEFRAVVKGDVSGTVEAIIDCLNGLCTPEIRVKVVGSGVGNISDGDIALAAACEGTVIGFNVRVDKKVQHDAHLANVPIKSYNIIYKLLDDVKLTLGGLLPPIVTTQVKGEATVQQVFQIGTKGRETKPVAGCKITNGSMTKNGRVRIIRDKKQIWEGELESLKQVKKDITEAKKDMECGMSFEGFNDFKEGDVIQSVMTVTTPRTL